MHKYNLLVHESILHMFVFAYDIMFLRVWLITHGCTIA